MTSDPQRVVIAFQTRRQRRDHERIRSLRGNYGKAVAEQLRAALRLEAALRDLEQASMRAERAARVLSGVEQRRIARISFERLMSWLGDVCKVRRPGGHFCIADLVRSTHPEKAETPADTERQTHPETERD